MRLALVSLLFTAFVPLSFGDEVETVGKVNWRLVPKNIATGKKTAEDAVKAAKKPLEGFGFKIEDSGIRKGEYGQYWYWIDFVSGKQFKVHHYTDPKRVSDIDQANKRFKAKKKRFKELGLNVITGNLFAKWIDEEWVYSYEILYLEFPPYAQSGSKEE